MRDVRIRDSLPNLVAKLFRSVARVHNRALKRFDVSAVQAHILSVLWLEGPMTIGELQAELSLGSSTLTGALDRMEKVDLVRRVPVPGDRRAYRVEPAAWSDKKKGALLEALAETDAEAFADLTAAERRELLRLLAKAAASIAKVDHGDGD